MKVLLLADAHGEYGWVPSIVRLAGDVDACVVAGDLTNFGPPSLGGVLVKMLPKPVLAVAGNCDPIEVHEEVEAAGGVCLHGTLHTIGNVAFMGIGGSNPTPFNTPFELEEEEIGTMLSTLLERTEGMGYVRVLVSHAPPYGVLDEVSSGHVGSHAVEYALGRVDAILCGHIHEVCGITVVSGTTVVSPAPAFRGGGALVWLDDGVRAELLEADEV